MTSDEFLEEIQKLPNIKIQSIFSISVVFYVKITETTSAHISTLRKDPKHFNNDSVAVFMPDEDKIYEYTMKHAVYDNFEQAFTSACISNYNASLKNVNVKDITLQECMRLIIEALNAYTNLYAKCKKDFLIQKLENI